MLAPAWFPNSCRRAPGNLRGSLLEGGEVFEHNAERAARFPRSPSMKTITFPALLLLLLAIGAVEAQGYPARPVRAVVGFAAGGQIDAITRIVTAKMAENLKQPHIVEDPPRAANRTEP